jgi:methyl-accepting chemotaxis protein
MTDTQKLSDLLNEARKSAERASSAASDAASEAGDAQSYADSATDSANSAESYADEVQECLDSVQEMVDEIVAENARLTMIIAKIRLALEVNADQSDVLELAESATIVGDPRLAQSI